MIERGFVKEKVICPVCGKGRLLDTDKGAKIESLPEDMITSNWHAQFYPKCPKCGKVIGIKKVG